MKASTDFARRLAMPLALVASFAASAQPPSDADAESQPEGGWSFTVTPYLWAAGLDGNTAADGTGSEIDTGYSFLSLDNLDLTLAAAAEARKGRWSVLFDGLYVEFSDAFDRTLV